MSVPALKPVRTFLPYGRQVIEDDDIAAVAEAMRGELLTTGPYVTRFESGKMLEHLHSCPSCQAELAQLAKRANTTLR